MSQTKIDQEQTNTNEQLAKKKSIWPKVIIFFVVELIFALLTFSFIWAKTHFGGVTMTEIIFHVFMPTAGSATNMVSSYLTYVISCMAIVIICSIPVLALCIIAQKKQGAFWQWTKIIAKRMWEFSFALFVIWTLVLLYHGDKEFAISSWAQSQLTKSSFIAQYYVNPDDVEITAPEEKRNLICIYIESAETTLQDKANGGMYDVNYIPEMTELMKNNLSFSQTEGTFEGADVAPACGWTIAGLVAETAGIPLKLYTYNDQKVDNSMQNYEHFLPGAKAIGEILQETGYRNYFMVGSEFKFGGRLQFFKEHGDYEVFDYHTAVNEGKIPSDYFKWWGFEDQKLYEYAKEKITMLAEGDQPFNFNLLTVDTHNEDGWRCELCENAYDDQYANVWNCASKQLDEFISWIQEQPFYENTTIMIIGDHCSMDSDFYDGAAEYDKHHGTNGTERKVYNCFINSAINTENTNNREFTTLDFFPTTLASIGFKIQGDRLGLGTNLFSDTETLTEELGTGYVFKELEKKSSFYDNVLLYP